MTFESPVQNSYHSRLLARTSSTASGIAGAITIQRGTDSAGASANAAATTTVIAIANEIGIADLLMPSTTKAPAAMTKPATKSAVEA